MTCDIPFVIDTVDKTTMTQAHEEQCEPEPASDRAGRHAGQPIVPEDLNHDLHAHFRVETDDAPAVHHRDAGRRMPFRRDPLG